VGLDRLFGDSQVARDLFIGEAVCQQTQDVCLALGQRFRSLWCITPRISRAAACVESCTWPVAAALMARRSSGALVSLSR
jgi:hypothetical protein